MKKSFDEAEIRLILLDDYLIAISPRPTPRTSVPATATMFQPEKAI